MGHVMYASGLLSRWLSSFDPATLYKYISWAVIAAGIPTFVILLKQRAPYGRYAPVNRPTSSNSWLLGPGIPPQIAWIIQECPSFVIPVCMLFFATSHPWSSKTPFSFGLNPQSFLLGVYLLHYFHRSFIYPLLIRGGKPTPLAIVLAGILYCGTIGLIQYLALATNHYDQRTWMRPHFVIGIIVFFAGMWINIDSDAELRRLRRIRGDTGYRIPQRGMFKYVSAANYFGECLEWCGYALACWNVAAVAFAFYTICNLAPRAMQHHQWYKQKFENYPRQRKAFLPFLL